VPPVTTLTTGIVRFLWRTTSARTGVVSDCVPMSVPYVLRPELARIRKQGYALDAEELIAGLTCVAVPV